MEMELKKLKREIFNQLEQITDNKVLRDLEIKYLGRKGKLTKILKGLANLSEADKKTAGKLANEIKREIAVKFAGVRRLIGDRSEEKKFIDITLPGKKLPLGHLNPLTIMQQELEDLFSSLGFMILDGPELESDYYNFETLNYTKYHPARDMQDTFYVSRRDTTRLDSARLANVAQANKNKEAKNDLLMRTHTSPMQIRAMRQYGAPLRVIVPGRCFRNEATDVRHEHTFYQVEGLMVDKNISLSQMKAVLEEVAKKLYGQETKLRLRPKFYPFVEPGTNGEVTCFLCKGAGCRLCKNTGWLEIFGSGMIHPKVLEAGGIDPKKYSGFAFGFGLNRLTQLKYDIEDIRLFMSGDLRFLEQF